MLLDMETRIINQTTYPDVSRIYMEGIETGIATFETQAPSWESWDQSHLSFGRIVAHRDAETLGWAALSPVSSRCVYGGVAEVSVYVKNSAKGQGVGKFLLKELITISEEHNIWTLQSGIFRENVASIALHEKCGFRIIGYKEKIGKLKGEWKDNILLERRSKIVGIS